MNSINKKAINNLGKEVNFHVMVPNFVTNFKDKTIIGQLKSFASSNVEDTLDQLSNPQIQHTSGFKYQYETLVDIEQQIQKYVEDNLQEIVSK